MSDIEIYHQVTKLVLGSESIYWSRGMSVFLSANSSESRDFFSRQCSVQLPPVDSNEIALTVSGAGVVADIGSGGNPSCPFCLIILSIQLLRASQAGTMM
jgi:hypothetical protein